MFFLVASFCKVACRRKQIGQRNDKNDPLNDVDEVTFDLQDSLTSTLDNTLDKVYRQTPKIPFQFAPVSNKLLD